MKIAHITVEGFLGARSVSVDTPEPIQLFAGANGAGKSSIRDGIALALTADLGRVQLKKDAGQLVNAGAQHALCEVVAADGDTWTVTITAAGKIADSQKGRQTDPALPYVLDAQRFAQLGATERRAFLLGLMGVKTDAGDIAQRMEARGCHIGKLQRVLPLLRSGFDAACDEAKSKATAAKGAWRAVTGETYGSEKAKTWRAAVPPYDAAAAVRLQTELEHADVAASQWQQQIGGLKAMQQHRSQLQAKLPALREHAGRIERIQTKLATDERSLAEWDADLAKTQAAAGAVPRDRTGLIHDLAAAVAYLLPLAQTPNDQEPPAEERDAEAALQAYEREHGRVGEAYSGDAKAMARLPSIRDSRDLMARTVENDRRDLAAAQRAKAELDAIEAELAEPFDAAALRSAEDQIDAIRAQRAEVVKKLDALKSIKALVDGAEVKTKQAAEHAEDVAAWDAIAQALAPDGIPAELLKEALGPINARLAQSAADAQWPQVEIGADMAITYGGRQYGLISESEQWRADAMLAEAIASQSSWRLLLLDRFDVLDLQGRADLIAWLDVLADAGEVDSVFLFGTLKSTPTGLPASIGTHWIDDGVVAQPLRAAA